jgi:hypothetical protein
VICGHDFTYREIINDDTLENKKEILRQFTRFMFKMHEAQIHFFINSRQYVDKKKSDHGYDFI